jgi:hypothetical protein
MMLTRSVLSSVILSGAKDPIPAYATTNSLRSFHHYQDLTSCVPSPVAGLSDLERPPQ